MFCYASGTHINSTILIAQRINTYLVIIKLTAGEYVEADHNCTGNGS